jgi:hypothetical protein
MNITEKINKYLVSEGKGRTKYSEMNFDNYMKKYKSKAKMIKDMNAFKKEALGLKSSSPAKMLDIIERHVKDNIDKDHFRFASDLNSILGVDGKVGF